MTSISIPTATDSRIRIPAKFTSIEPIERIGVSVKKAAEMLDLCEKTMWTLVKDNKIRSVRIGSRVIVSVQSLREFVDGKESRDSKGKSGAHECSLESET